MAGRFSRVLWPLHVLAEMRGQLFAWVPVFLGCGIGLWFALPFEPGLGFYGACLLGFLGLIAGYFWGPEVLQPLIVMAASVVLGLLATGLRAHLVASPMLEKRFYGAVQGRVIEIDRSQSDALRITLDRVVLQGIAPDKTPVTVRISLHGQEVSFDPGQVVLLTAALAAPEGPAEPGGFDFRRMAYFERLGAVGYTRSPVLIWAEPAPATEVISRWRTTVSRQMMQAMPGEAGAFATGAMTGDRSGISLETVRALRDSNLAHLLAISGMNMAFITGFVFALLRYGMALVPAVALRVNSKKVAALVAFAVAGFYLALSGANVATTRAFLMVSVMLGAILLDRRALTLRSVALAALILLLVQPESLLSPGFQLSFAATVALIAGFGGLDSLVMRERLPRWIMPLFTLVLTSILAGAATAPFAAATFNRFTDYGLLANLLTVPVMSLLMAAGAVAALLAPFGLSEPALWLMEAAGRWILFVAHWVAGLQGAITPIVQPGFWVMPLITFAALWMLLWRGRARWAAVLPMILGLILWGNTQRPMVLISSDGNLVGRMGPEGRALSMARGAGFSAQAWLQDDGDLAMQSQAFARTGFTGEQGTRAFTLGDWRGVALAGKAAAEHVAEACAKADLVVLPAAIDPIDPPEGCLLIGRNILDQTGALALSVEDGVLHLHPTRDAARIWMSDQPIWQNRRFILPQHQ